MILATAIRDGVEHEIPERAVHVRPMERLTFHRQPTPDEVMALLPCLAAKDGEWRVVDGPWHGIEDIGKLIK